MKYSILSVASFILLVANYAVSMVESEQIVIDEKILNDLKNENKSIKDLGNFKIIKFAKDANIAEIDSSLLPSTVEKLILENEKYLKSVSLKDLLALKEFDALDGGIKSISLENVPSLETFRVNDSLTRDVPFFWLDVNIKGVKSLTTVDLSFTYIRSLYLEDIKEIYRLNTPVNIEYLTLKKVGNLKALDVSRTVKGLWLEDLADLARISFDNYPRIGTLEIINLPLLKTLKIINALSLKDLKLRNVPLGDEFFAELSLKKFSVMDLNELNNLIKLPDEIVVNNFRAQKLAKLASVNVISENFAINDLTSLEALQVSGLQVKASKLPLVKRIKIAKATKVEISDAPQLSELNLQETSIEDLTIEKTPSLLKFASEIKNGRWCQKVSIKLKELPNINFLADYLNKQRAVDISLINLIELKNIETVSDIDLSFINLWKSDFTNKKVINVKFNNSWLTDVSFINSTIKSCDYTGAAHLVPKAKFNGAEISDSIFGPGTDGITLDQLTEAKNFDLSQWKGSSK